MLGLSCNLFLSHLFLVLGSLRLVRSQASITPFLEQSYFFDWTPAGQALPTPVTGQCDNIHIQWSRSAATGPNPTAPYYLQVYTSAYIVPFIISAGPGLSYDWQVPFAPGTQYQICMFDKYGNTGGCQAIYTVIPNATVTTPTCPNVTIPAVLDVNATVINGPLSQYGWVDQCTDISLTPLNGTPPYTFTVAPSLHPPYNITGKDMSSLNWTVSLTWASPFFISIIDSVGNGWANGPLHSGGGGTINCLLGVQPSKKHMDISPYIAVGSGLGGLIVGLMAGAVAMCCIAQRKRSKRHADNLYDLSGSHPDSPQVTALDHRVSAVSAAPYRAVPVSPSQSPGMVNNALSPSTSTRFPTHSTQYQVEAFVMPNEDGRLATSANTGRPTSSGAESSSGPGRQSGAVYVVHHDSGRSPVSVYHEDGTQVVELPPRYLDGSRRTEPPSDARSVAGSGSEARSDSSRTDATDFLNQSRHPGPALKPLRPST